MKRELLTGLGGAQNGDEQADESPNELRDLASLCQLANDSGVNHPCQFSAERRPQHGDFGHRMLHLPKNEPVSASLAAEMPQVAFRSAAACSQCWNCGGIPTIMGLLNRGV
jgi:hypothetical protein